MYGLTARQRECLAFIGKHWLDHGYPPSVREISAEMGFTTGQAAIDHLQALQRKDCIERVFGDSRAIKITTKGWSELGVTGCPLCGSCRERVA